MAQTFAKVVVTAAACQILHYAHSRLPNCEVQAKQELGWAPEFGLVDGLRDSYEKDFGRGTYRKEADFETDDKILAAR